MPREQPTTSAARIGARRRAAVVVAMARHVKNQPPLRVRCELDLGETRPASCSYETGSFGTSALKVSELAFRSTPALPARPDQRVLDEYCGANGWRKKAALEPSASDAAKQLFLPRAWVWETYEPSPSR